jgi:Fe-S-cluster containining protein
VDSTSASPLSAGDFSAWLEELQRSLKGDHAMDVACGDCRGCCTSSMYILVRPHEQRARELIGAEHLMAATNMAAGNLLMGYDAHGYCRMFRDGNCSIYPDRPETCRSYDCRVFAAVEMPAGGPEKGTINARIARWRFEYRDDAARAEQRALAAAANYLRQHPVRFPGGFVASRPTDIAVIAVKCYKVFLAPPPSDGEIRSAIVDACREFDTRKTA